MSYAVIFREWPLDRFDALVPSVRQAYGLTDYDARMKLRRAWGFLERNVAREDAERLASTVDGCMALETVRELADPHVMKGIEFTPAGIVPTGANLVEWADLQIIAAGAVTEEVIRRETKGGKDMNTGQMLMGLGIFMVTGMPFGLFGGKKEKKQPVKTNRLILFGRLVTRQGQQYAFSLDHFNFIGLGNLKQLQALANFRVLFAELQRHTSARLNTGARLLLANQALTAANYSSVTDFETELLWLFNVP